MIQSRKLRLSVGTLALAALVALALPIRAERPHPKRHDQYKHQVEQLEEVWRTAVMNGDADAMDKLLSEDYVGITMAGQVVTKSQQLDRMRKRSLVVAKMEFEDVKVKLIGSTAIVTCLGEVEGTNDGDPMHGKFRYIRVYSRLPNGTWKITNFEATRVGPPTPSHAERFMDSPKPS
ncbi:MAG: nuclear transport factor 2 family protein [Acidobacteriota bacterium]|nr:nuclear transport factor 2 family protein [Acidobacteriota bacterium]